MIKEKKILLIPGSMMGLIHKNDHVKKVTGGFNNYFDLINSGKVKVFIWSQIYYFFNSDIELNINIPLYLKAYFKEKKYIQTDKALELLKEKITAEKPQILICHSAGCEYLILMLNKYINVDFSFIEEIRFYNNDASSQLKLRNSKIIEKIKSKNLRIWHNYCFYDYTLWISILLNFRIPQGLFPFQKTLYTSKLLLLNPLNYNNHNAVIKKLRF
jgi:hypothetical protein